MKKPFQKVLVANRGEIAVRIIRTLRELGIPSVAVYSTADADALHVRLADEALWIGTPHPLKSYLDIDAVIGACRTSGADALHPGYGFLAENPDLAERCETEGIAFIGPPASAIRLMGDKIASRKAMTRIGVPVLPGSAGAVSPGPALLEEAEGIGYPLIVKAAAGGGGRGMRLVREATEILEAVEAARHEAAKAFGDDTVFLERQLDDPRHVEVQVLGDRHGAFVHLFERECSIQRRNQKIVEETPSPFLDDALREEMGLTAVRAARAAKSSNASTVEFLMDASGRYSFLEMNTRIQVEHPVTEMTTGMDLVAEQIRLAAGEPLGLDQADVARRGHAVECRIYAEDPEKAFQPSPGRLLFWKEPAGPGVRVDAGVETGSEVHLDYDPILAKLAAWGPDRETARRRAVRALREFVALGVDTNVSFLIDVLEHEAFRKGQTHTGFLPSYFREWSPRRGPRFLAALATAAGTEGNAGRWQGSTEASRTFDPWRDLGRWELGRGRSRLP